MRECERNRRFIEKESKLWDDSIKT